METRRRLRPLAAPVAAFFAWIGRPVTRALLFVIQLIAALIAIVLEVGQLVVRWGGAVLLSAALIVVEAVRRHVTPRSTVAFVGVCAAVGLGVSQFFDYHGVAVDAPNYAGRDRLDRARARSPAGRRPAAPTSGSCCRSRRWRWS